MRSDIVVELEIISQSLIQLVSVLESVEVDAFILEAAPESLDKGVISRPSHTIHTDFDVQSP